MVPNHQPVINPFKKSQNICHQRPPKLSVVLSRICGSYCSGCETAPTAARSKSPGKNGLGAPLRPVWSEPCGFDHQKYHEIGIYLLVI